MKRCAACLIAGESLDHPNQTEYRNAGARAIGSANSLVFPSTFLKRQCRFLYPDRRPSQQETIISPATRRRRQPSSQDLDRPHVAFIGGVATHKGGALIGSIWQILDKALPNSRGMVYGNGESALIRGLKATNRLDIRGYYRRGGLTRRLDSDRIGVSILPSIWPETYGLVVDESLAAGVPVVAFDLGAVADRLGSLGVGRLVPKHLGPAGLAEAAVHVLSSRSAVPESIIKSLPDIEESARLSMDVYRNLLSNAP
jgi:glycosyltransferase involved in cell wall biosynthesis